MKVIIIEDEQRAQILLKGVLNEIAPEVEVLAVCDDLPSGVIAIRKYQPELVFLDIEMPQYNGLDIVHFFNPEEINFSIVFTTAYQQYAIDAFKTSALDYLLKPIDPDELKATLIRFTTYKKVHYQKLIDTRELIGNADIIAIPDGNQLVMVNIADIMYLKADNSYTELTLVKGKKMVTSRFLKNFEESLQTYETFFRCHKSYIINTKYIKAFNKSNGGTVVMENEMEIPVSVEKTEDLLQIFIRVHR